MIEDTTVDDPKSEVRRLEGLVALAYGYLKSSGQLEDFEQAAFDFELLTKRGMFVKAFERENDGKEKVS